MTAQDRKHDELIPPNELIHVGDGDFRAVGELFLPLFVDLGGLRPDDRVLDVGCGIGRMALPLLSYLSDHGTYDGFDIVQSGIDWCNEKISQRYPNFRFQLVDIYNSVYNPQGKLDSITFQFPYSDSSFDFVLLTSVFTHMLADGMKNYFSEISRVLKPNARSFITFFLWNPESKQSIMTGKSTQDFRFDFGLYRTTDAKKPEQAVCYDEEFVLSLHETHGLQVAHPVYYGSWCGRPNYVSYQDIVIATKRTDADS